MFRYEDEKFKNIIKKYILHPKYQEMKKYKHHGLTRYEHSLRVAYQTYKITKFLHLNYQETTIAALLHDFFLDEVINELSKNRMRHHPKIAAQNASLYFEINDKQRDMIETHMFPLTLTPPSYLEGWLIDLIDDWVSIYERIIAFKREGITKKKLNPINSLFILIIAIFK